MDVLVVGAGIAGPTLAHWLARSGHRVTMVEQAPQPRRGGYLVDFWGAGFDVAERMGLAAEIRRRGYVLQEVRAVDARGRRIGGVRPSSVTGAAARYVSIPRSELAQVVRASLDDRVEIVLGETVETLEQTPDRVDVLLTGGRRGSYDLVVGADGVHSRVRALTLGAAERYERPLGVVVAAFEVAGYRPRDELVALMYAEVGFQVVRVSLRDDTTLVLVTVRDDGRSSDGPAARQDLVRARLTGAGWETPAILDALASATSCYTDTVSQVRMPTWSRGRVTLVGDAAACPSLLAGQGSALAMVEAYVLAAELGGAPDPTEALRRYEQRLAGFVRSKQDGARGLGGAFAPANRRQLLVRDLTLRAMGIPGVADLAMGRSFRDAITLPEPVGT